MADLAATLTAEARLARRCRLLLVAYPPAYRAQRGEEILGTLLDTATPGQRAPRFADAVDLVVSGVRLRIGAPAMTGFDGGLVAAAPIALALAAGISAFAWWRIEPIGDGAGPGEQAFLGLFRTAGPMAYLAWVVAALVRVALPARAARPSLAVALGATVSVPVFTALTPYDRPPLWVIMALAVFGGLALAGTPAGARPSMDERLAVLAGTVGLPMVASALVAAWPPVDALGYYQPTIARVGVIAAGAVGVVATYALILLRRRGGDPEAAQRWFWATALLGLPAGWLGPFDSAGLRAAADASVPHFGRLAQVLLATGAATVVISGLAQRRPTPAATTPATAAPPSGVSARGPLAPDGPLSPVGFATLGFAAGLAGFLALGASERLGFAESASRVPVQVVVTVLALFAAGLCGAVAQRPTRLSAAWFGGGFAVAFPAAWLVAAYDNGWTLRGWPDYAHTAALVATLAFLPFALCVVAAVRVLATRTIAALPLLIVSLGWVGYAAVPSVLSWGPVLVVLGSGGVALTTTSRRRSPMRR